MIKSTISTDYTNRTVDIELLQTIQFPGELQPVNIFSLKPNFFVRKVSGIQKLVQRYFLFFITAAQSVKWAPRQGTNFLNAIAGGYLAPTNIHTFFAEANSDVIYLLSKDDDEYEQTYNVTIPDDEKIESASLIDFNVDSINAILKLVIEIKSKAGDSTEFILPIAKGVL